MMAFVGNAVGFESNGPTEAYNATADIWSLGITCIEMVWMPRIDLGPVFHRRNQAFCVCVKYRLWYTFVI